MLPVLLDLGIFKIYTYGVFLLLAFFWSAYFLWKNILLTSFKEEDVFDSVFVSLVIGLLIGRTEFVLLHLSDYNWDFLKFFLINGYPGIGYIGFLLGFFASISLALKRQDISIAKVIDCIVPPFLLGIAIAKIGAFFSGTEIGSTTDFPVALIYQNIDGPRHVTALYESILYFGMTYLSYRVLRSIRRDKFENGFNGYFFIFSVSLVILIFDNFKSFRVILPMTSVSLDFIISGISFLTILGYYGYYFRDQILNSIKEFWKKLKVTHSKD